MKHDSPKPKKSRNPYYQGPVSNHFDGEHFFNPGRRWNKSPKDLFRWMLQRRFERWPNEHPSPFSDHPPRRINGFDLRVSFVGHASFLIQTAGLNLLLDPVWSDRVSPLRFAGPKRVNPPGIDFQRLPPIDVVLISHNHYDHLDLATLRRLHADHAPRIITPLGNDTIIRQAHHGIKVEAYDWGDRVDIGNGVAVHLEEAYHWSARGIADRLRALWAAFVIETPGGKIYHIGDTGYHDGKIFSAVREKHGLIRLALLPIGAYEPRWFMAEQHMNPEEAVRAFVASGAQRAIAHHWGTFQLTHEGVTAPPEALEEALKAHNIAKERFAVLRPGEVLSVR
jgi:L-ascorbate metabolism protein UlaG (beta-lactamase superfamily)